MEFCAQEIRESARLVYRNGGLSRVSGVRNKETSLLSFWVWVDYSDWNYVCNTLYFSFLCSTFNYSCQTQVLNYSVQVLNIQSRILQNFPLKISCNTLTNKISVAFTFHDSHKRVLYYLVNKSNAKISQVFKNKSKWRTALLVTCFYAGILLGLFFDPVMEATFSSETSIDFQRTIWLYIRR
jgi:hypothetical protein